MTQRHWFAWCLQLGWVGLLGWIGAIACASSTLAQSRIVPDNTLGAESSIVRSNVQGLPREEITGGAIRGVNLFHSFREFNVDNGRGAYFENKNASIKNIFTRVTGNVRSEIFGTLGTIGNAANLFLINPNGILFGPNARLDVRGSFLGTTANSFVFPNGVEFSATNPQAPPLLTISVPIGLQFGSQPGQITSRAFSQDSQGNRYGLSVAPGNTLALIGGEITLDNSLLYTTDGQVQLGAVGGGTTVGLLLNGSQLGFSLPENAMRSPITLTNSLIQTTGNSSIKLVSGQIGLNGSSVFGLNGGSISIDATGLNLDNGSQLTTRTRNATKAGDLRIQASDAVTLTNGIISSESNATGNGGDIGINARNITIAGDTQSRSSISTFTNSQGNAGNLTLEATECVKVTNGGSVFVLTSGAGNTGDLTLQARESVNITDNGILGLVTSNSGSTGNLRIETGTFNVSSSKMVGPVSSGSGSAGSIFIQARDAVELINGQIYANALNLGQSGNITIETQRLNLRDGGLLNTNTYGAANAGNIVIRASDSVTISGVSPSMPQSYSYISSDTGSDTFKATGNGGNITIETPRLTLSQGGTVSTSSIQSEGNAGSVTIRAKDVELDGFVILPKGFSRSSISTQVSESEADVLGGTLSIDTERLRLSNGAELTASVIEGRGQGGNLVVRASDSIDISGVGQINRDGKPLPSGLFAQLQTGGIGSGGSINVETGRLSLSNGGAISADNFTQGNAGNILINAAQIDLRGESTAISTQFAGTTTGNGGDIRINNTQRLNVQEGARISSTTFGNGNAGNLIIQANDIELRDPTSGLFSSAVEGANGNGGTINIVNARQLNINEGARISVSSRGGGIGGNINIKAQSVQLRDRASIFAETASQDGGNIRIDNTDLLLLRQGSRISTTAAEGGNGGNINLNSKFIVAVPDENSDITANAYLGRGGAVQINTQGLIGIQARSQPTPESDITASSTLGVAGVVNIYTPDQNILRNNLTQLPENIIDANTLVANSCIARRHNQSGGTFFVIGNGGLPERPGEAPISTYSTGTIRTVANEGKKATLPTSTNSVRSWKTGDPIIAAQGIYRLANGDLVLGRECPLADSY